MLAQNDEELIKNKLRIFLEKTQGKQNDITTDNNSSETKRKLKMKLQKYLWWCMVPYEPKCSYITHLV